jgi:hypothetical protein
MPNSSDSYDLERRGVRFLRALRCGDAATLAVLWHEAESDPELETLFEDLLDEEDVTGEQDADESMSSPASLQEEKPLSLDEKIPLPPLPTVIVRHRWRAAEESPRVRARQLEEPHRDAGFIEKA